MDLIALSNLIISHGCQINMQDAVNIMQIELDMPDELIDGVVAVLRPIDELAPFVGGKQEKLHMLGAVTGMQPGIIVDFDLPEIEVINVIRSYITFNPDDGLIIIIRGANMPDAQSKQNLNQIIDDLIMTLVNYFTSQKFEAFHIMTWKQLQNLYIKLYRNNTIQRFDGQKQKIVIQEDFASLEDLLKV